MRKARILRAFFLAALAPRLHPAAYIVDISDGEITDCRWRMTISRPAWFKCTPSPTCSDRPSAVPANGW